MDTSLIDVDVQPTYVRVMVKGKVSVTLWAVPISEAQPWIKLACLKTDLSDFKIEKEKPSQSAVFLDTRF